MSKNALQRLVIALVGLLVLYGVIRLVGGRSPDVSPGALELAAELEGIDERTLESATFSGADREIEVARVAGEWTVNGYEADSAAVARMFTALSEVEVGALAAANPDNHERLGVTGREAWMLEFRLLGGESRIVALGRVGSAFQTAYARLPGSDEVYTVRGDVRGSFTRTLTDWRDKLIARTDVESIESIEVERDGGVIIVERDEAGWTVAGSGSVPDSATVANMLDEVDELRAIGFVEEEDSEFPTEDVRRFVALSESGDTVLALEMAPVDAEYRVRAAGNDTLYRLAAFRATRIVPELDRLLGREGVPN